MKVYLKYIQCLSFHWFTLFVFVFFYILMDQIWQYWLLLCDARRHEGVTFVVAFSSVFPFNPVMMMLITVMMKLKHIALVFNLSWRRLRDDVTRPLEPKIKRRVIVTTFKNIKRFLSLFILQKLPTLTLEGRRRPTTKVNVCFSFSFS